MWNRMRMNPRDAIDVSGFTYTYLHERHDPRPATGPRCSGRVSGCGCVSSTARRMSYFDVRIPGLKLHVISADGQDVEPVDVDEFRMGAGGNVRRDRAAARAIAPTPSSPNPSTAVAMRAARWRRSKGCRPKCLRWTQCRR